MSSKSRPPLPAITDTVVNDPYQLGAAIDAVTTSDKQLTRLHKQIRDGHHRLREALNDDQWALFMRVEEQTNTATAITMSVIAKVFFRAGKRARR
jgi:hypothetical protein